MSPLRRRQLLALSFAGMLAACASTPPEATVQVFTSQPQLPAGSTYRFERLPSQANQPGQIALEAAADGVLARAGLRRDDAAPRLSVQLTGSQDAWPGGPAWGAPSVGIGIGGGSWGSSVGVGLGFPIGGGGNRASQRVDVLVRDLTNGQVLFQSQASGGSGASAASLLDAAMRGFPNAPPGTRQVPLADATPR